jgi:chemotaxis protein methyltransferase CheR
MTVAVEPEVLERFRDLVVRRLGLYFNEANLGLVSDLFRQRLEATGQEPGAYLARFEALESSRQEIRELARGLTVAETYFFRNFDQFRAFSDVALRVWMRAPSSGRRLRILSAGCASGEEPYSLAILVREHLNEGAAREVSIKGVDVNPVMLEKAASARYSPWSLRETPPELHQRYFRPEGRDFALEENLRASVRFEERNLAEEDPELWQLEAYDVIFCRNVLMYFSPEKAQALVARIARALSPGGLLFLGHAETLRGLSQDFHLCHSHGTFYYQRKEASSGSAVGRDTAQAPETISSPALALHEVAETAPSWVETIRRAAERIKSLAHARAEPAAGNGGRREAAPFRPRWDLGVARELLEKERFAEALALLRTLPPESAEDTDVLLLKAVLLTLSGNLAQSEKVCSELLALDEMSAGAHYLMALCREAGGNRQEAIDHDQVAIYLDPGFAMARLHLGLMARRAGDKDTARRELGQALLLLQREDASRLLLFGGGFSREALVALCRSELVRCGGTG